jgi:hypothetical protein
MALYRVSQKALYAVCRYAECRYAECHLAECRHTECRGAIQIGSYNKQLILKVAISHHE